MDAASPRFFGSHVFPVTDTLIARECLVRLGKHEARALVVAGQPITVWKVRQVRSNHPARDLDLTEIRAILRVGPALAKACRRAAEAP